MSRFVEGEDRLQPTLLPSCLDGSKFKAVNATDKAFTPASLERRMDQVDASIGRYLTALETADRQEGELVQAKRPGPSKRSEPR